MKYENVEKAYALKKKIDHTREILAELRTKEIYVRIFNRNGEFMTLLPIERSDPEYSPILPDFLNQIIQQYQDRKKALIKELDEL